VPHCWRLCNCGQFRYLDTKLKNRHANQCLPLVHNGNGHYDLAIDCIKQLQKYANFILLRFVPGCIKTIHKQFVSRNLSHCVFCDGLPLLFSLIIQLRDWAWLGCGELIQTKMFSYCCPPVKMVDSLKRVEIDGYCVGEPWNSLAGRARRRSMLVTGYEIWGARRKKYLV